MSKSKVLDTMHYYVIQTLVHILYRKRHVIPEASAIEKKLYMSVDTSNNFLHLAVSVSLLID